MAAYVALAEVEEDAYTKDGTTDYRNNPAIGNKTGTWKACLYILVPRHDSFDLKYSYLHLLGFGWDSLENDYKLIAKTRFTYEFFVYSSKTDSWSIGVVSDELYDIDNFPSVIVKGIPYWKSGSDEIVKFETGNNKFTKFNFGVRKSMRLLNLNDCLAMLEFTSYGADVYQFDEESRERKKMYTINNCDSIFRCYRPMCFKNGGEIVLVIGGKSNLYDPRSEEYKTLCHRPQHKDILRGYSYSPSLLALEGMKPLQT
ncbi:hypothetical protein POM88_024194 [Heracleum sosnowskyi]|uniref:Uncharacterized protein n=1 Tax=Heracleum sosnowskyi TaxID=360622 RepID=A0AAD8I2G8_9APIA|nr:hypothetical protein POM88_024194 [Heracleum sosnowskyi]